MSWTNYHSHTYFCDGNHAPAEWIHLAREAGMIAYGISSHAPVPFDVDWCMKREAYPEYRFQIDDLKRRLQGQIELYCGLEVDFIPDKTGPNHPAIQEFDLDYTVGSVHFIDYFPDGRPWEIDGSHQVFREGLKEIFGNDIRRVLERYFELTRQMLTEDCPDILGHLDKIKIQNQNGLWDEQADWYQEALFETLKVAAASGVVMEANTRGMYKKKTLEPYPGKWALQEARKLNIPLCMNSDSHHKREMLSEFPEAAKMAMEAGYTELHILYQDRWQSFPFDENGIQLP